MSKVTLTVICDPYNRIQVGPPEQVSRMFPDVRVATLQIDEPIEKNDIAPAVATLARLLLEQM